MDSWRMDRKIAKRSSVSVAWEAVYLRFSLKSFNPDSPSASVVTAGSQPITADADFGAVERKESAKAGAVSETGVGGSTRW